VSDWISYEALLTEGYRRCAKLTWRYGTTYFWGAALLSKPQRKHVHAIYALCRLADDIVDPPDGQLPSRLEPDPIPAEPDPIPTEPAPTLPDPDQPTLAEPAEPRPEPANRQAAVSAQLEAFAESFRNSLRAGDSTDPVMAAVVHTVITCGIDPEFFDTFFNAMAWI
jgi:15-cis-phytoene synthase